MSCALNECQICYNPYNKTIKKQLLIKTCGHHFCLECFDKVNLPIFSFLEQDTRK